jgi:hypothetical protein
MEKASDSVLMAPGSTKETQMDLAMGRSPLPICLEKVTQPS